MSEYSNITLYDRPEYFVELAHSARLAQKGDRVAVSTMSFEPTEPLVDGVMEGLQEAASNGADTQFAVDAFAFMAEERGTGVGPLWFWPSLAATPRREPYRSRYQALQQLAAAGVRYAVTNVPKVPFSMIPAGRSHIKAGVVKDSVYIGGCNLRAPEEIDLMARLDDARAAKWVFRTLKSIIAKRDAREALKDEDRVFDVDPITRLLVDAGVPGQSRILEEALGLIDDADEYVTITGQYFPGGPTAQHLLAAHKRNVRVRILFSHPQVHGWLASIGHHAQQLMERARLPAEFFEERLAKQSPKMHAKIIATDKGAIAGSHNYLDIGVALGTAEIALLRRDPGFSKELIEKIDQQLTD